MDLVTSRPRLFDDPAEMATTWFNIWSRRLWPADVVSPGDVLWWYEGRRRAIVWRTLVGRVESFAFEDLDAAVRRIDRSFGGASRDDPYLVGRPSAGHALAYTVDEAERVSLPKPAGLAFSRSGWERGDRPEVARWLASAGAATGSDDELIAAHAAAWLADTSRGSAVWSATEAVRDLQPQRIPQLWPRYRIEFGRQMIALRPDDTRGPDNVLRGMAMQARIPVRRGDGGEAFRRWAWQTQPVLARRAGIVPVGRQAALVPFVLPPPPTPPRPAVARSADAERVARGVVAHHSTLARLHRSVVADGGEVVAPGPAMPLFDLAWRSPDGGLVVAEVKSITGENEEEQLRLGLGQVLRYRQQLRARQRRPVEAWLVPEREPTDGAWHDACRDAGVRLFVPPA